MNLFKHHCTVSHASVLGHKIPAKQKKRGMDKVVLRSCMYVKKQISTGNELCSDQAAMNTFITDANELCSGKKSKANKYRIKSNFNSKVA